MGITTTALAIGSLMMAGGAYAGAKQIGKITKTAKERETAQRRIREQELEAQRVATAEVLAAPEKAAERARKESLARRRRRAKTILTSPAGVLEPGTIARKTLLGE
ncbi:MAG: hypothetical protein KAX78_07990 [Phycisphaerae bacterium]|nr:hypothetical protein [Phycisphaerae bacterium]